MVFNTLTVGAAVAPTVVKSSFSHFFDREPRQQKPTAHISYDTGLSLIRKFIEYGSRHTVEELQAFTSQWVPVKPIVRVEEVIIGKPLLTTAAEHIRNQLGQHGVDQIGGGSWWEWRRGEESLEAEWIEMRRDSRQNRGEPHQRSRIMLYVHGGAYYFGSVDTHRFQLQRHARKLKARVLARTAKSYPFPCGLLDCLATYIFLLKKYAPSEIVLAGDSAGAGMVVSMLIIIRDQHLKMPAGAILISPWVDLTHSFPSVSANSKFDYIPAHGFIHKPSLAWPPVNEEERLKIGLEATREQARRKSVGQNAGKREVNEAVDNAARNYSLGRRIQYVNPEENGNEDTGMEETGQIPRNTLPAPERDLAVIIGEDYVPIKDQIQMYTTNRLISHPLVSPVLQPSLGGLPPLLILTGGGELLRDEQIYLAHKAANPVLYPPPEAYLNENPQARQEISKWKPTNVQLQVWDDLCHVAPTLSFTRPAKLMYRSIAQFGAWALSRAQDIKIEVEHDDSISVISSESGDIEKEPLGQVPRVRNCKLRRTASTERLEKAGCALPRFHDHMIRQHVDRHGNIYALDPPNTFDALRMSRNEIGVINPRLIHKWLKAKEEWDRKYVKEIEKIHKQRVQEELLKYRDPGYNENPPPSALKAREVCRLQLPKEKKKGRSWGMSLWTTMGSKHDKETVERERLASITEGARERLIGEQVNRPRGGGRDDTPEPETRLGRTGRHHRRTVADSEQNDGSEENVANNTQSQASSDSSDNYAVLSRSFPARLAAQLDGGGANHPVTDIAQPDGRNESVASATDPQGRSESIEDTAVLARRMLAQLPVPGTARIQATEQTQDRFLLDPQPDMPNSAARGYDIAESEAPSLTRLDAGFGRGMVVRSLPGTRPRSGSSELPAKQPGTGGGLGLLTAVNPGHPIVLADNVGEDVHYFEVRYSANFREALAAALADMGMVGEAVSRTVVEPCLLLDDIAATDVTVHLEMRVGDRNQLVISRDRDFYMRPTNQQAVSGPLANSNDPINENLSETLTDAIANLDLRFANNSQQDIVHALGNRDYSIRPNNRRAGSEVSHTPTHLQITDTPPVTAVTRGPNSTDSSDVARMPPNPFNEARAREARARHPKRKLSPFPATIAGCATQVHPAVDPTQHSGEIGSQINPLLSQPVMDPSPGSCRSRLPSFVLGESAIEPPLPIHGPSGIPVIYESVSSSASECEGRGQGKAKAKGKKHKRVASWATKLSAKDVMELPEQEEIPELDTEMYMDPQEWSEKVKLKKKEEWVKLRRKEKAKAETPAGPSGHAKTDRTQKDRLLQAPEQIQPLEQAQTEAEVAHSKREIRMQVLARVRAHVESRGPVDHTQHDREQWEAVIRVLAKLQAELQTEINNGLREGAVEALAKVQTLMQAAKDSGLWDEGFGWTLVQLQPSIEEALADLTRASPDGGRDGGAPVEGRVDDPKPHLDSRRGTGPSSDDTFFEIAFHAGAPASGGNSTGDLGRLRAEAKEKREGKQNKVVKEEGEAEGKAGSA